MVVKLNKNSVTQKIDLETAFDFNFSNKPALRQAIGEAILEKIRARTESGSGMKFDSAGNGRQVTLKSPYSKEYADSPGFKAFGKSKSGVNMTLTGDMLGLMDIISESGNSLTIGWKDRVQNNKAFNHVTGDTVPSRPFFGVSKKELNDIKKELRPLLKEALKIKQTQSNKAFEDFATKIIGNLTNGES